MAIQFRTRSKAIQPNPNAIGACCVYNESSSSYDCSEQSFIECKKDLGIFRGEGSLCEDNPCPINFINPDRPSNGDSIGACNKCTSCSDGVEENNCITPENFDAEFFGGKTCFQIERDKLSSLTAVKYACCVDDGCFDTCNETFCSDLGGVFHDGVNSPLAQQCESNPCDRNQERITNELGACCFAQSCLGLLTQQDCQINGGSWKGPGTDCRSQIDGRTNPSYNWNCVLNQATEDSAGNENRPPTQGSQSGGNIVCSIPTPKKYYIDGKWNSTEGPTYGRESVVVRTYTNSEDCILAGGVVSATDGDTNKIIMWGGCQYNDGQLWKCESKTYDQCRSLSGSWQAGVYCDDIRSYPASGLLLADSLPSGVPSSEKFLAGSCYLIDNVLAGTTEHTENRTKCFDMMTEYACARELQKKMDYYLAVIEQGTNVGFNLDTITLNTGNVLETKWRAGQKCSDCTSGEVPVVSQTLGQCRVDDQAVGNYTQADNSIVTYTVKSGEPKLCLDNYTKSDCDAIIGGQWMESCFSCFDFGQPSPRKTGSCCTDSFTCIDDQTEKQCNDAGGFFHGLNTTCLLGRDPVNGENIERDCSKVAFLSTDGISDLDNVFCKCQVENDPNASDANVVQIFARQDSQDGNDIWAGSTCGDPNVDAYLYWNEETNFADNLFVLNTNPVDGEEKFSGVNSIAPFRYNIAGGNGFRDFIISGTGNAPGSFLDDILIQKSLTAYFQLDGLLPQRIPYVEETLKNIRGTTLATNQPAETIHRLMLNDSSYYYTDGPVPLDRQITYVNLEGMTNLREFAVQGNNWTTMQTDFEAQDLPNLRMLDARSSELTSLSFTKCAAIEEINLGNNNLSTLDLSSNQYITSVDVPNNNLTSLNIGTDKIYLSKLNIAYNSGLTSVIGTYPQLEYFFGARCNLSNPQFIGMPFLKTIDLTGNPLSSIKIENNPSISEISLDSAISVSTDLLNCTLPNKTNRNMTTSIPTSIEEAIIPNPYDSLEYFSFRNNTLSTTNYNTFGPKLCQTIMNSKTSALTNTSFSTIGTFSDQSVNLNIDSKYIDFSNVQDTTDDVDNPTNSSVLEILNYIFNQSTTSTEERITINLTGINTSVHWNTGGALRENLTGPLVSKITFIL